MIKLVVILSAFFVSITLYAAKPNSASMEPVIESKAAKSDTKLSPKIVTNEAKSGDFTLKWLKQGQIMTLVVKGKTSGWVAVMIGAQKKMKNGDIYIGYVKDGKAFTADHYGIEVVKHKPDTEQGGANSIIESSGWEKDGFTEVTFKIDLSKQDSKDNSFAKGDYNAVLAAGPADNFTSKHNQLAMVVMKIKE